MKMGRSIYTVERSKAVLWMYLSNIYIYMYSSLRFFIYISLSYLQHCFIRRIKLPRIFLHSNCFFPFRTKFLLSFPSSLESAYFYFRTSTRVTFESEDPIVLDKTESLFRDLLKLLARTWGNFYQRWKYYKRKTLDAWNKVEKVWNWIPTIILLGFFFFLNDYSWTCLVASDIQMRFQIRNGPWILFDFIFPFQCILCQFDF